MTPAEAKRHIEKHNLIHQRKEPFAVYITDALGMAVDALDRLTPKKPEMRAMEGFAAEVASELCCPHCLDPVINYWRPGTRPAHCQFCGQALDWGEEVQADEI